MVNQFYTAKNDIVFKAVMVRNERVLRRLLEVILEIDIDEIYPYVMKKMFAFSKCNNCSEV